MNVTDQRPKDRKCCLPDNMERPKRPLPVDPAIKQLIQAFAEKHDIMLRGDRPDRDKS